MYTRQEIILRSNREGKSQRQISRELGISRKTVSKYLIAYENTKLGLCTKPKLSSYLSTSPKYATPIRSKTILTDKIKARIDALLSENAKKRARGMSKQQLKKIDIHAYLKEQGYLIGYTTVCNYIREQQGKQNTPEAFIRQHYEPGSSCEFDWGEVKLNINGVLERFQLAVFTSSYSNYRYALLYKAQDTISFMESHVNFFTYTGGVYKEMVYDNMRVAVSKFVGKYHKEPTKALLTLRGHYLFTHRFCNARKGNEKGHVERSVEYLRRKAFALKDDFKDLETAQKHLLSSIEILNHTKQQGTGKTANEQFAIEKQHLLTSACALECAEASELRVDKYATISWRGNRYSAPETLVGQFVWVKRFSNRIEIYNNNVLVGSHNLFFGKHGWTIDISHYLETFKRKPGALSNSVALISNDYLKEIYSTYFKDDPRDFIELLSYLKKHQISGERLEQTLCRLTKTSDYVNLEKLKALLGNTEQQYNNTTSSPNQTTHLAKQQLEQINHLIN
jgi:transposase